MRAKLKGLIYTVIKKESAKVNAMKRLNINKNLLLPVLHFPMVGDCRKIKLYMSILFTSKHLSLLYFSSINLFILQLNPVRCTNATKMILQMETRNILPL